MIEYITNIPVEKLKPFPNHPFHFPNHPFQVRDDDSMRDANTDANEPFARRIQTSKTVYLNQGNGRLNQAKQRQAIQYNWIKPH